MNGSQRIWKILLFIHVIVYELFFILALDSFKLPASVDVTRIDFIVLLFWTPVLLIHVAASYRQFGRGDANQLERNAYRDAYRDGFADAMKQLGAPQDRIERLALDDEGELVELPKRKRSDG